MPRISAESDGSDDLRFQQKVWEGQSGLGGRRQTYRRERKAGLGLKVVVPLLLLAVAGYHVAKNTELGDDLSPPVTLKRQAISVAVPEAPLDFAPPSPARGKSAAASRAHTPESRAAEISEAALSVKPPSPSAERRKAPSSAEALAPAVAPAATLPPAHDFASGVAPLDTSQTAVVTTVEPKPLSPATPPLARIRITQSLACQVVEARQCISKQSVFTLNEHNNPHIWMNVRSQSLPHVLKHIYYHEGRKYAEIPLVIKYPHMRTWSNVTLQSPTRVGSWRVEIVTEDGHLLDQVMFRVTP